ncbi:MAG: type II toxin-antitoxin system VapC family toxin [Phycisphaerae bacterium]
MMLVDTSVWIHHFRHGNAALTALLNDGDVLSHPFVIGELACGNLKQRREILSLLEALPSVTLADHDEVLAFVDGNRLMGTGIGWIDAHLLSSAVLTGTLLWTLDKRLGEAARSIGVYGKP